ncbi:MAG: hypothetical protein JW741_30735 [Sedimentisphaerales bacterium]|nr:hypothetical protein [Sedimentisphaerales bacterium]
MAREERIPHERAGGPAEEIDLFDYLRVIHKYRRMILAICVLAAVTTGVVCILSPITFLSTTSIMPPLESLEGSSRLGAGMLGGAESALLRNVMNVTSVADVYVGILESRAVSDALVERFDLTGVYEVEGAGYEARNRLRENTKINASDEGLVYITVEDRDPSRAAAIANAYVEELDEQNKRLSSGQATSKRVFLENRLKEIEQKLSRIESIPSREAQVQEMLYELLIRESEIAKIEEAKSMPTIQVLDPATPPERRKARGTVRKTMLAGIVALVFGIFLAFAREYCRQCRRSENRLPAFESDSPSLPHAPPDERRVGGSALPVESHARPGHRDQDAAETVRT